MYRTYEVTRKGRPSDIVHVNGTHFVLASAGVDCYGNELESDGTLAIHWGGDTVAVFPGDIWTTIIELDALDVPAPVKKLAAGVDK